MDGYDVQTIDTMAPKADIFVTATGNKDILTLDHMRAMKDMAIVCNIGHFDNEIQVEAPAQFQMDQYQAASRHDHLPRWQADHPCSQRAVLVNLGNATGHPSFVMSASFTNQTLAQIALHENKGEYGNEVYTLPKHLDEKVARLHLAKLGVELTDLSKEQADYIGVTTQGPFKPEHYRY